MQMDVEGHHTDIEITYFFNYEDSKIINPFLDVTGRESVNPVEYYGENFVNSNFYPIYKEIVGEDKW